MRLAMFTLLACFSLGSTRSTATADQTEADAAITPVQPEAVIVDYGNWCGYNNTREDRKYPVKDAVDDVCRTHDLCLRDYGYHDCRCDSAFLTGMDKARAGTWQGESYRVAAILAFQVKPCMCPVAILVEGVGGKCEM